MFKQFSRLLNTVFQVLHSNAQFTTELHLIAIRLKSKMFDQQMKLEFPFQAQNTEKLTN